MHFLEDSVSIIRRGDLSILEEISFSPPVIINKPTVVPERVPRGTEPAEETQ